MTEETRATKLEQMTADLKARSDQIDSIILGWNTEATILRDEQKEIVVVLDKLEKPADVTSGEPESII